MQRAKVRSLVRGVCLLLVCIPALDHIVRLVRIVASRVTYPMDLEWMEGGVLYESYRFIHGDAVYAPVSSGYLPFPYAPFHFALLGALGRVFGLDYWSGRLVSVVSLIVASAAVSSVVHRHWRDSIFRIPAVLMSLAWIAASYPVVAGWYDLIRIDTLALALVTLAACAVVKGNIGWKRAIWIALLLTAAIFTKQVSVVFAAWMCLFLLVRNRMQGFRVALTTGVACIACLALVQITSHGGFWFYAFTMLSKHRVFPGLMGDAASRIFGFAPFIALVPVLVIALAVKRKLSAEAVFWTGILAAALGISIVTYAKETAWLNVLTYAVFFAGPLTLVVVGECARLFPPGSKAHPISEWVFAIASAVLLWFARYDGSVFTVSPELRARAESLNALIAKLDGAVVYPTSPFLPIRNGRGSQTFHTMAYRDALGAGIPTPALFEYLQQGDARYLVTSGCMRRDEYPLIIGRAVDRLYAFDHHLPEGPRDLPMLTGYPCAPEDIWRRRQDVPIAPISPRIELPWSPPSGALQASIVKVGGTYPATSHACALHDGSLDCWGANDFGQVLPEWRGASAPSPVHVGDGVDEVAVGGVHTCARTAEKGSISCWGDNREGALGDGTQNLASTPVPVAIDAKVVRIAAGGRHTCAVDDQKSVLCWGRNRVGQIGIAPSAWSPPTRVASLANVVDLALGDEHSCARIEDGTVMCWGGNARGQLGDGAHDDRPTPKKVNLPGAAISISAGDDHTCVILESSAVACWGGNAFGDLGNGSTESHPLPIVIRDLHDAQSVALGGQHSCIITKARDLFCWGVNISSESGQNWWREPRVPEQVIGMAHVTSVSLGNNFTCATHDDLTVQCWGKNERGQLGTGTINTFDAQMPLPSVRASIAANAFP